MLFANAWIVYSFSFAFLCCLGFRFFLWECGSEMDHIQIKYSERKNLLFIVLGFRCFCFLRFFLSPALGKQINHDSLCRIAYSLVAGSGFSALLPFFSTGSACWDFPLSFFPDEALQSRIGRRIRFWKLLFFFTLDSRCWLRAFSLSNFFIFLF